MKWPALGLALLTAMPLEAAACDRGCLKSTTDRYLSALVAHKPGDASLSPNIRSTQNGAATPIGSGLWQGAGPITLRRDFYDTETGNVAVQLGLSNYGAPAIALIHLKVSGNKVVEQEIVLAEKGKLAPRIWSDFDAFAAERQPQWNSAPKNRATRAQLLAVARTYFDAIATVGLPSFKVPAFAETACERYENGLQVTNKPFLGNPPANCRDQFAALGKLPAGTMRIIGPRFPVVDVELGVVAGFAVLVSPNQPSGVLFGDLYKVDGSQITAVQIVDDLTQASDGGTGWASPSDQPQK